MCKAYKTKGFTLVELLISIAIGAVIFSSSFWAASAFLRAESRIARKFDGIQSVRFSMDRILKDTRGSKGVNSASTDALLILDHEGFSVSYDYLNGKVRRRKGGGSSYLTDDGKVLGLKFDYPKPGFVKVLLLDASGSFECGAFVRNQGAL